MNQKRLAALLKMAQAKQAKLDGICGAMAIELQPFFTHEISVDFQPGDGFCVIWEDGVFDAPNNIPVSDAIKSIVKDAKAFL